MTEPLQAWLDRLERRTPESQIRLGLDRVRAVLNALPERRPRCPVITVAGTNGKGSVVAMLEAIYCAAGYRTFAYTSPHLLHFGERIRVNAQPTDPAAVAEALARVERYRQSTELTYFEHVTLAALVVAASVRPDVVLLEVGLGGRLDAVNAIDPDVSVITSIGLDHVEWLGGTRRSIAAEKAGIARPGKPLIVGERRPPRGWVSDLDASGAELWLAGRDFRWRRAGRSLRLSAGEAVLDLPPPALAGAHQWGNAACAVMAARALAARLPVSDRALCQGLQAVQLAGRLQCIPGQPEIWLDVAHNAQAARVLSAALSAESKTTTAVFNALAGKDIPAIGKTLAGDFERWLVPALRGDRTRDSGEVADALRHAPVGSAVETVESVGEALKIALAATPPEGRVVIFGSFRTVAEAWPMIQQRN
ncbi:bifunctional folylpolyglutamate synthase/dihydrofolate synthase [Wenzhouxiangella limi]|uniref:Dihydrofolate synthase/folylpolyglutamate synthase n=1 Tax=Wenzhouxiangella limi TaxID=2707351 RepID=A0A845VHQ3_9GAMM|nr:folylpolyglutamate synthase/dihydrofolate synthase family protein [Wenzhouxiangella limi]NDY96719.1 bifunctional folylpolyglutamate synthase/dihydrofolate synthase [Wenzhouxiangella limi]